MSSVKTLSLSDSTDQWKCPHCTTVNGSEKLNCEICLTQRPGVTLDDLRKEQEELEGTTGRAEPSLVNRFTSFITGKEPRWVCPRCTYSNNNRLHKCEVCNFKRIVSNKHSNNNNVTGSLSVGVGGVNEPSGSVVRRRSKRDGWFSRFIKDPLSSSDDEEGQSESTWDCAACTLKNPTRAKKCRACKTANPNFQEEPRSKRPSTSRDQRRNSDPGSPSEERNSHLAVSISLPPSPSSQPAKKPEMPAEIGWNCPRCRYNNLLSSRTCYVCSAGRPLTVSSVDAPSDAALGSEETHHRSDKPHIAASVAVTEKETNRKLPSSIALQQICSPRGEGGWGGPSFFASPSPTGVRNHTVSVREEHTRVQMEANVVFAQVCLYCSQNGEKFIDPDFPPASKSLYEDPRRPVERWRVAQWLRPSQIVHPRPHHHHQQQQQWQVQQHHQQQVSWWKQSKGTQWCVFRSPSAADIIQGVLGNCWVLSAVSVIAEIPKLLQEVFLTDKVYPEGIYQMRFCIDGEWQVVNVDDCFPCYSNGELVFSKSRNKELWVPLLEKGLAKLFGSYEALESGRILNGLSILTGLPCENLQIKKYPAFVFAQEADVGEEDLVWTQLLSFRESGYPMGASCGDVEGSDVELYHRVGLEPNHAYSILDVKQIQTGERLVRLRNPWGRHSWNGRWSDNSPEMIPELRAELGGANSGHEGIFWMDFYDFLKYFSDVDVCKYRPDWLSTRMKGKLYPYAPSQQFLMTFEVLITTEVDIVLYQPSLRGSAKRNGNMVDLSFLVLRYTDDDAAQATDTSSSTSPSLPLPLPSSCALSSKAKISSVLSCSAILDPGKYVVLPLAFNHWRHPDIIAGVVPPPPPPLGGGGGSSWGREDVGTSIPYTLALFTSRPVVYSSHMETPPGFLAESIFLLAEKEGKKNRCSPNMEIYQLHKKWCCTFIVAVNRDRSCHMTVTCTADESINMVSTRGALITIDTIPPMHRQVVMVLCRLEATQPYACAFSCQCVPCPPPPSSNRAAKFLFFNFTTTPPNAAHPPGTVSAAGDRDTSHVPEIHPMQRELHAPRPITTPPPSSSSSSSVALHHPHPHHRGQYNRSLKH